MTAAAIIALGQGLLAAIPKIVELIKKGRDPSGIKLGEVISTDALATLEAAKAKGQDFVDNG